MKTKTLLFLPLLVFLIKDAQSKTLEKEATLIEIQIRSTPRVSPRSKAMKTTNLVSRVKEVAPAVYLIGGAIAVNFITSTSNASIVVTNADTGEVVHHELFSSNASTTILVDLQGCQNSLHYIDIVTSSACHSGAFVL